MCVQLLPGAQASVGDEETVGGADVSVPVRHPRGRNRGVVGPVALPLLQFGGGMRAGVRRQQHTAAAPTEVDSGRGPLAAAGVRRRASDVAALRAHRLRAAAEQT